MTFARVRSVPLPMAPPGALALGFVLSGCAGPQSMLAPAGAEATDVFHLSLVLFAGAGLILAWVVVTLALALFGPPGVRAVLSSRRAVLVAGLGVPLVVLTLLLVVGLMMMRERTLWPEDGPRIAVVGEQWWWRVTYLAPDGQRIAGANEIRIPVGETVTLALDASDVIHSFWVPSLGGKRDMVPGRTNHLRIRAEREGRYRGQCAEYCGGAHAFMALEIIAMAPDAYRAWLMAAAEPPAPPSEALAIEGQKYFLSTGCGACHAISGTPATGLIGPDLTRVGARRQIGSAMLDTSPETLARFIADAPAHKPGTLMPAFPMLAREEIDAMAAYLWSLR
ncbi:MAG: c-type cytochrome [Pseudomonadota bacterium]